MPVSYTQIDNSEDLQPELQRLRIPVWGYRIAVKFVQGIARFSTLFGLSSSQSISVSGCWRVSTTAPAASSIVIGSPSMRNWSNSAVPACTAVLPKCSAQEVGRRIFKKIFFRFPTRRTVEKLAKGRCCSYPNRLRHCRTSQGAKRITTFLCLSSSQSLQCLGKGVRLICAVCLFYARASWAGPGLPRPCGLWPGR